MNDINVLLIMGIVLTAIGIIYPALTIKHRVACKERVAATVVSVETKRHYSGDRKSTKICPPFLIQ